MASPAFRAITSTQSSGTGFTATEPTGAAEWDILFWLVGWVGNPTGLSTPSGWTEIGSSVSNITVKLYAIRRGSSAPTLTFPTWTGTFDYTQSMIAFSGATRSGAVHEAIASTGERNNASYPTPTGNGTPNPASVTSLTPNAVIIAFIHDQIGSGGADWSAPSGYTLRTTGSASWRNGIASKALGAPAADDPGVFTTSADYRSVAFTVSLPSELVGTSALTAFAATVGGEPGQGEETFQLTGALSAFPASSAGAGAETIDGVGASTAYAATSAGVGVAPETSTTPSRGARPRTILLERPPMRPEIYSSGGSVAPPASVSGTGTIGIAAAGASVGPLAMVAGVGAMEIGGRGASRARPGRAFGFDEREELALLGLGAMDEELTLALG